MIGTYWPSTQKKGECEAFIDGIEDGETFWTIQLDKESKLDVREQKDAEIISRLVRIEELVKSRWKKNFWRNKHDNMRQEKKE